MSGRGQAQQQQQSSNASATAAAAAPSILTPSEAALQIARSKVDYVQIDALAVLKLVKHCHELTGSTDLTQGILTGMVQTEDHGRKRIEVTNCFPLPTAQNVKIQSDYDDFCRDYTQENLKTFRHLNIDHLIIGWYQSSMFSNFVNKEFIDSQYMYQSEFDESISLIYDPFKIQQGSLYLKAFRLTPQLMQLYKNKELTSEAFKNAHLNHENFIEELPVVIRNSHLVNSFLLELDEVAPSDKRFGFLDLATNNVLEKTLRNLIVNVDELCSESNKFINYQKQLQKTNHAKQQYTQRRDAENSARLARGEPPLPEDDLSKFKPPAPVSRLETLLVSNQIKSYCQQINDFTAQSFSRMFIAEALQNK